MASSGAVANFPDVASSIAVAFMACLCFDHAMAATPSADRDCHAKPCVGDAAGS